MKQKPEKGNRETLIKPKPKIKTEKTSAGQGEGDKREEGGGEKGGREGGENLSILRMKEEKLLEIRH